MASTGNQMIYLVNVREQVGARIDRRERDHRQLEQQPQHLQLVPSSPSSCGIVSSAPSRGARSPSRAPRRLQVRRQVVDEDALLRRDADRARRPARRSRARACACPTSPEITTPSNSSREHRAVVAAACPRSSRSGRCGCRPRARAHRLEHRLVGPHAARTGGRSGPPGRRRRAARPKQRLELLLGRARPPRASSSSVAAPSGSPRNASRTARARGPRVSQNALERREHVRRQHAAEVDEQPAARRARQPPCAIAQARARRAPGTPSSSSLKNGSSVVPASSRL